MDKMCGNCSGDHKFADCPFVERQVTKEELTRLQGYEEKAKKYDTIVTDLDTGGTEEMLMEENVRNRIIVDRLLEFEKDFKLWAMEYSDKDTIKISAIVKELNKIFEGIEWPKRGFDELVMTTFKELKEKDKDAR